MEQLTVPSQTTNLLGHGQYFKARCGKHMGRQWRILSTIFPVHSNALHATSPRNSRVVTKLGSSFFISMG